MVFGFSINFLIRFGLVRFGSVSIWFWTHRKAKICLHIIFVHSSFVMKWMSFVPSNIINSTSQCFVQNEENFLPAMDYVVMLDANFNNIFFYLFLFRVFHFFFVFFLHLCRCLLDERSIYGWFIAYEKISECSVGNCSKIGFVSSENVQCSMFNAE